MKRFFAVALTIASIVNFALPDACRSAGGPDLSELTASPPFVSSPVGDTAAFRFNELNTRIRDGKIPREEARRELRRLLADLSAEYYRRGGRQYLPAEWVFPLASYDSRAITGGRNKGYIASGYDYYSGNRHGGHPSFDVFIRDRDQDNLDDRTGRPVKVLSLGGGVVVAMESAWEKGSTLRGGKYIWVYDPANELLVYYAHNSGLHVRLGDLVKPGDVLADVGRSGYNAARRRSPTHLHLTVLKVRDGRPLPVNVYPELKRARRAPAE